MHNKCLSNTHLHSFIITMWKALVRGLWWKALWSSLIDSASVKKKRGTYPWWFITATCQWCKALVKIHLHISTNTDLHQYSIWKCTVSHDLVIRSFNIHNFTIIFWVIIFISTWDNDCSGTIDTTRDTSTNTLVQFVSTECLSSTHNVNTKFYNPDCEHTLKSRLCQSQGSSDLKLDEGWNILYHPTTSCACVILVSRETGYRLGPVYLSSMGILMLEY